jgi:hypothetical protein
MDNVLDFNDAKIEKEQLCLEDIIQGFTAHNCDKNRPCLEQQPKRAMIEIKGLTRRDISDCMALGILECKEGDDAPRVYVSEKGNLFKDFDSLEKADEGFSDSYVDPERVTYNDLYGWNMDNIDPVAAIQNMACHLERRMNIYPALIDGELSLIET